MQKVKVSSNISMLSTGPYVRNFRSTLMGNYKYKAEIGRDMGWGVEPTKTRTRKEIQSFRSAGEHWHSLK